MILYANNYDFIFTYQPMKGSHNNYEPLVSVIMPVYRQEHFMERALSSLLVQTFGQWELIIIDDGSPGNMLRIIESSLQDGRIKYYKHFLNEGLGAAINAGINRARSGLIAYLPADDVIYENHLEVLYNCLLEDPQTLLAFTSVRHHYNRMAHGIVNGEWLQLVQVMHRKGAERWTERKELESDDLNILFWNKLKGPKKHVPILTCDWTDHPDQRHKMMREPIGGINTFRSWYDVRQPLIFHTTTGNYINEEKKYRHFRKKKTKQSLNEPPLKILLVGELAYNAERILALEERGHILYGLWMKKPYWFNTVGPLPFGQVTDITGADWKEQIERIQPDLIYALLNWQAVPMAHKVLKAGLDIPFVWHFKEGPFICIEKGLWDQLIELYKFSDANIFICEEMQMWVNSFLPASNKSFILDGDLPKKEWCMQERSPLLSERDGEFHTVVPGRPIGLHPQDVQYLADQKIHLHFYGDFTQGQWKEWIEKTQRLAAGYLHIHPNVDQDEWVREFSRYDAGWLHFFQSTNYGEITKALWDDLNIPARMSTLALAGLPMLQYDNAEHTVAMQSLAKQLDMGLFFKNMSELKSLLLDKDRVTQIRNNVWRNRAFFTFDYHTDRLIGFFYEVISSKRSQKSKTISVSGTK
jgi:glycosyltransferase involved in cell wall biosynthesis